MRKHEYCLTGSRDARQAEDRAFPGNGMQLAPDAIGQISSVGNDIYLGWIALTMRYRSILISLLHIGAESSAQTRWSA